MTRTTPGRFSALPRMVGHWWGIGGALVICLSASAQPPTAPQVVPLWEGKAPHAVSESKWDKPTLTAYLVPKDQTNGAAVVICPGGGYGFLADDHEGKQVAAFFNKLGVHAFVLQYRIVQKDRPGPLH